MNADAEPRKTHLVESVEVGHFNAPDEGPAVLLRCGTRHALLSLWTSPDHARAIAQQLMTAAARADYEADFYRVAQDGDAGFKTVGEIFVMIREGASLRSSSTAS